MTLQGVKQNPDLLRDDLRRMSLTINDIVKRLNSGATERVSITSTGTTVNDDGLASIYYINATGGAVTFNLKPLSSVLDRLLTVKKIDSSTNTVTLTSASTSELIDGTTTKVISSQFVSHEVHAADIVNWFIL